MIRGIICALAISGVAMSFSGCGNVNLKQGKSFDSTRAAEVKDGISTKAEILNWFGEPLTRSLSGTSEEWNYSYTEFKQRGAALGAYGLGTVKHFNSTKTLIVVFEGDKVSRHSFTESKN